MAATASSTGYPAPRLRLQLAPTSTFRARLGPLTLAGRENSVGKSRRLAGHGTG